MQAHFIFMKHHKHLQNKTTTQTKFFIHTNTQKKIKKISCQNSFASHNCTYIHFPSNACMGMVLKYIFFSLSFNMWLYDDKKKTF